MIVIATDTQLRFDETAATRNGLRGIGEILADVLAVYRLDEADTLSASTQAADSVAVTA